MPIKTYRKPNRTLPRPFTVNDVARLYCQLVERGIPDEVIDVAIDDRCGDDRRRKSQAAQAAAAAVAEGLTEGGSIEDAYLDLLRRAADMLLQNSEYLNAEISILKRQKNLLRVLAPAGVLLRRFAIGAPFAAALRLITRQVDGQLAQMLPLQAANESTFQALTQFVQIRSILRAAGGAL